MSATATETVELFRAPAGKTWHIAKTAGFPVALDGYTTPANVDAVVETGIDARAERHAGLGVCRNCRNAAAGRIVAKTEPEPVAEKPKSNGAKKPSKSASIEKLSKTETAALVAKLDELAPKRDKYVEDRAAGKPAEKRRNRSAYQEYEAAYARIRRSGQTVREARAAVAK